MSLVKVTPTASTIVELEDEKDYVAVRVAWEWEEARYVLEVPRTRSTVIDADFVRRTVRRDEGCRILHVTHL